MDANKPLDPPDPRPTDPRDRFEPGDSLERLERGDAPEPSERARQREQEQPENDSRRAPLDLDDLFDL